MRGITKWLCVLVGILPVLMVVSYFLLNDEPWSLDEDARESASAKFARIYHGVTHYELKGEGPLVVLVHGVSGPMKVWDKVVDALSPRFKVLRYDLFGRGFSDRVKGPYNQDLYDVQLFELLRALSLNEEPVTLVGSSMGAIVSSNFTLRHPEHVKKLVLIGPAGFPIKAAPASKLIYFPVLGEYLMGVTGSRMLQDHHWKYFVRPAEFPIMHDAFAEQLKYKGTKGAILSTMRNMPVNNFKEGYERIGEKKNLPVLLIWGTKDVTFPYSNHELAQKYMPQTKLIPVENAAHLPQYEEPEATNQALQDFLAHH